MCKIGNMRAHATSSLPATFRTSANSLFRNILPLSSCESGFWVGSHPVSRSHSIENKYFRGWVSKTAKKYEMHPVQLHTFNQRPKRGRTSRQGAFARVNTTAINRQSRGDARWTKLSRRKY